MQRGPPARGARLRETAEPLSRRPRRTTPIQPRTSPRILTRDTSPASITKRGSASCCLASLARTP